MQPWCTQGRAESLLAIFVFGPQVQGCRIAIPDFTPSGPAPCSFQGGCPFASKPACGSAPPRSFSLVYIDGSWLPKAPGRCYGLGAGKLGAPLSSWPQNLGRQMLGPDPCLGAVPVDVTHWTGLRPPVAGLGDVSLSLCSVSTAMGSLGWEQGGVMHAGV